MKLPNIYRDLLNRITTVTLSRITSKRQAMITLKEPRTEISKRVVEI